MTGRRRRPARTGQRGFTLIEIMVSLTIGFAVVGALLAAWLAAFQGTRHNDALLQITEDATVALGVMRQQIAQAGFSVPHGSGAEGLALRTFPALAGCEAAPFADPAASLLQTTACAAPAANADGLASDAVAVAYEVGVWPAGASNAIVGGPAGDAPLDCLGNSFERTAGGADGDWWLAQSKFYVADGNLDCHGPGNAGAAALVQNVESLQVRYGMTGPEPEAVAAHRTSFYDTAPPPGSDEWRQVVAVSVCIQVRSADRVLDARAAATLGPWIDCANQRRSATDGYLRRTFSTTIALQNRLP